uniref:Uncharacterized protein n=1 Tax=Piliocolobus tephrosceles TaxID=591936 RepID=A0A8C9HRG5_9PRIM
MSAWSRPQSRVWWQGGSGREFTQQPGDRGEQEARGHPSTTGTRGPCWAAVWKTHGSWPHLSLPSSLITCLPPLQRFRFCGDLDCPNWVLAEVSTLAKMSSVKLWLLCSQVLKELLGRGTDVSNPGTSAWCLVQRPPPPIPAASR